MASKLHPTGLYKKQELSAEQFIQVKNLEYQKKKPIKMKDIGRKGFHIFERVKWTFHIQHNLPEKVFVIEKLKKIGFEGEVIHKKDQKPGAVEYRFGYYLIGKIRNAHGRWIWGQFCPLVPDQDWKKVIRKAQQDGTIPK